MGKRICWNRSRGPLAGVAFEPLLIFWTDCRRSITAFFFWQCSRRRARPQPNRDCHSERTQATQPLGRRRQVQSTNGSCDRLARPLSRGKLTHLSDPYPKAEKRSDVPHGSKK